MQIQSRSHLQVLQDVVFALFLRELKTRFGAYRLGVLWAALEPIAFILLLSALRSLSSGGELFGGDIYDVPTPIFFMLGYVPFQLFSKLVTQTANAVSSNRGLFHYRQVRPIDAVLARILLEMMIFSFVLIILMTGFWWFDFPVQIDDPLLFITAFILLVLLGGGLGLIVCVAQLRFPEIQKLVPLLMRPLFFISGLFFSLRDIPSQYHYLVDWNPILHVIELLRGAAYSGYDMTLLSPNYVAFLALATVFFGLAMYRLDWKRMVAS